MIYPLLPVLTSILKTINKIVIHIQKLLSECPSSNLPHIRKVMKNKINNTQELQNNPHVNKLQ